jgi:hypothetical protein
MVGSDGQILVSFVVAVLLTVLYCPVGRSCSVESFVSVLLAVR